MHTPNTLNPKTPALWGYAGVFPGEFRIWDGDELLNKLRFMAEQGFGCTGLGLKQVGEPARLQQVSDTLRKYHLSVSLHFHASFFTATLEELRTQVADYLARLDEVRGALDVALIALNAGPFHRFMREPNLAFQMDRLALALQPLAAGCAERGIPLGIENHIDYFATDLAALCDRVPGLGIFFDTGNSPLLGEKPLDAARVVAPYLVGTHFKDLCVIPDENTLSSLNIGATLGEGDMDLENVYQALIEGAAHPEKLVMQIELIPPPDSDPWESLRRSKDFIERISGHRFLASIES